MSDSEERQLVERLRAGDEVALAEYVELKRLPLLGFVRKNTSDQLSRKVEPDDILQEVSLSAMASIGELSPTTRDPFSWLCRIAERRIIDAHRRHFAQKRDAGKEVGLHGSGSSDGRGGLIDVLVASLTSPSSAFSRGQREHALLEALAELPEDDREALRMRYVENLPSKEIAVRLARTDGATRVLLTRALRKLQRNLQDNVLFESFGPAEGP